MNKITLIGRLHADPADGLMTVVTTRSVKAENARGWNMELDHHFVALNERDATFASKYMQAGSLVSVEGSVVYVTKRGEVSARIEAERVALLANGRRLEVA